MNLNSLLGGIGIKSNLAGDVSFLILFVLISMVVSFAVGKNRLLISLLGVYAAYAVVSLSKFDFLKDPSTKTLIFLAIIIGFVMLFSKIIRSSISGHGPFFIAKLTLGTAIVLGLSLSIILSWYTPKELADTITPNVRSYFTGDLFRSIWGIAPLVYLAVVRKKN